MIALTMTVMHEIWSYIASLWRALHGNANFVVRSKWYGGCMFVIND
jgi:hypothetical protein